MKGSFVTDVLWILLLVVAVGFLEGYLPEGSQHIVALILILGLFAAAFDLAFGWTGLFSIGHAAFFGAGAYAYSLATLNADASSLAALALSMGCGAALAALFGALGMRATGIYFSLTTLALGQLASVLSEVKLRTWTGGTDGIAGVPRPQILHWSFDSTQDFVLFVCACFALGLTMLALLRRSGFGQVLRAIRENPTRTQQLGYDVKSYRIVAMAVSGAVSALAGALFSALSFFVGPEMMSWQMSGDVLIMTVLGGAGTLFGPVLGAAIFELSKEIISRYTEHWYGFVGALFVVITLLLPNGLAGLAPLVRSRILKRREPRAKAEPVARQVRR